MRLFQAAPIGEILVEIPFKKRLSELDVRVGPPQESNFQKVNFTSENAGLISQNRRTEDLDLDRSVPSNEEEHFKN